MKTQLSPGKQILISRQEQKLSQLELAIKCNLNVRTIQRIENEEVTPRLYTLRIISEVLGIELLNKNEIDLERDQQKTFAKVFRKRKQIRMYTFYVAIFLLAAALVLLASGIPKMFWAPFIYILFFVDLLIIGLNWRCPGCNGLLGDLFNTRYCSKCGLTLEEER